MIIGLNCTKNAILIADTTGSGDSFKIKDITSYPYKLDNSHACADLHKNLRTLLSAKTGGYRVTILRCSGGRLGSSVEAIKAEAIAELACEQLSLDVSYTCPQSLKSALGCASREKWQDKAKELFNPEGQFKHFGKGSDGAAAAAYKEASK